MISTDGKPYITGHVKKGVDGDMCKWGLNSKDQLNSRMQIIDFYLQTIIIELLIILTLFPQLSLRRSLQPLGLGQ